MRKVFLLVVLSVFFSGCAAPVKRYIGYDNVVVSENHPKIRLAVPYEYEFIDSFSGKKLVQFSNVSGSAYEHRDWFYFKKRNAKGVTDSTLTIDFSDASKTLTYDIKNWGNSYFNRSAITINDTSYTTFFEVHRSPLDKDVLAQCSLSKRFWTFLNTEKKHLFSISYIIAIPCNQIHNGRVDDDSLLTSVDKQANELVRRMSL
ncbi:hypothetical protein [Zooshikella ganghwensis]|uniref:hypothetical protein n=1 Tax=Zooshikella ganghwensis TaxID=202772 RepID=UPI0003FFAF72|nr:hypothetical protein [Zooshikella ganghwensis]